MIGWLADPIRAAELAAWGFIIGTIGFAATLLGLFFTYRQARDARKSADEVKKEVEAFGVKQKSVEAMGYFGEARASIEMASVLIGGGLWKEAASAYDEARKVMQKARSLCGNLSGGSARKLKLLTDHLAAFSSHVDNALAGKGEFPDAAEVRASIRKSSDDLTLVQRELQEGMR